MGDADEWDRRYTAAARSDATLWSLTPNQTVAELLADAAPGVGVDLAAGEGRNALWLAQRRWTMLAVDFSAAALSTGRRMAAQRRLNVQWIQDDVTSWHPPAPVDLVLVAYLHLPRAQLVPVLAGLPSWLAHGGILLVVGHDVDNLTRGVGGPQDPDVLYTPDLLAGVANGLAVERCEQRGRVVRTESGERVAVDTVLLAHAPALPTDRPASTT